MIKIQPLQKSQLPEFFIYLKKHLSENDGLHGPLFQPLSKNESLLTEKWKVKFANMFDTKPDDKNWRKLWIAQNADEQIVGHIDIRNHKLPNVPHRVLLGMGVDSSFRKLKIGQKLVEFIIAYCKNDPKIAWLDLEVMAVNAPAINLYKKFNFDQQSYIKDMFQIDGQFYDYVGMSLNVIK